MHVEWYHLGLGATGCRPQCILELFLQLLFLQILLMCNLMYIHPALDSSNSRFKVGHCPGKSEKIGLVLSLRGSGGALHYARAHPSSPTVV